MALTRGRSLPKMPEFIGTVTGIKNSWDGELTLTLSIPVEIGMEILYAGKRGIELTLYVDVPHTFQVSIGDKLPIQINEIT